MFHLHQSLDDHTDHWQKVTSCDMIQYVIKRCDCRTDDGFTHLRGFGIPVLTALDSEKDHRGPLGLHVSESAAEPSRRNYSIQRDSKETCISGSDPENCRDDRPFPPPALRVHSDGADDTHTSFLLPT